MTGFLRWASWVCLHTPAPDDLFFCVALWTDSRGCPGGDHGGDIFVGGGCLIDEQRASAQASWNLRLIIQSASIKYLISKLTSSCVFSLSICIGTSLHRLRPFSNSKTKQPWPPWYAATNKTSITIIVTESTLWSGSLVALMSSHFFVSLAFFLSIVSRNDFWRCKSISYII